MAKPIVNEVVCENLFSEIASTAERVQVLMKTMESDTVHMQVEMLEAAVFHMGWLADVALTRMGSAMRVHDGDAIKWMASPSTNSALAMEVQHG